MDIEAQAAEIITTRYGRPAAGEPGLSWVLRCAAADLSGDRPDLTDDERAVIDAALATRAATRELLEWTTRELAR